ncbi:16954_t:CDS:1, partial [Dentiscutata heterogama]
MAMNHSITCEESDIKRSFISANEEIKTNQIILPNHQRLIYTSKPTKTKEVKLACESAKLYEPAKFE